MTEGERMARAQQAEACKATLDDAIDMAEKALLDQWKATATDHVATREKLHSGVAALAMIRKAVIAIIADGQALKHSAEMAALLSPAHEDRR